MRISMVSGWSFCQTEHPHTPAIVFASDVEAYPSYGPQIDSAGGDHLLSAGGKHWRSSGQRVQHWSYGAAELVLAKQTPGALKRLRHCRVSSVPSICAAACAGSCLR